MAAANPPHGNRAFAHLLWGIGAGILTGLFFGEEVAPLGLLATGFIRLLQVNVLPYLLGSLIYSLGSRGSAEIRRIARYGSLFLLLVWGLALLFVVASPFALPPSSGMPVFSVAETPAEIDWLDLYIPANLFHALANNLIPAVVLFGILSGLALGQVEDARKTELLRVLAALNETMARVSRMIVRLTPFGLFAIAAVTAGELRLEDLIRLQVWFGLYAGGALALTLVVLPLLVDRFTPVRYGRFLREMRGAIVTAAAAGDVLVVLPLVAEAAKELLVESGTSPTEAEGAIGVAVPLLYNFPHAGKILSLAFLPFAAWFSGAALDPGQMALLATAGPLSLFGSINAAMPFLLDLLHLPSDLFRLFTISSLVNTRFGSMVAATHLGALALVVAAAMIEAVEIEAARLARFALAAGAVLFLLLGTTRAFFTWILPPTPHGLDALSAFELRPPLAPVVRPSADPREPAPVPGQRLREIGRRGTLRVGYFADAIPWAFVNARGDLVGHDVEAAHRLATELGLELEFVPVKRTAPGPSQALDRGEADIIMSGLTATVGRGERMALSRPYSREHLGFLVRDHDRGRFRRLGAPDAGEGMTIAVPPIEGADALVNRYLPKATTRPYESVDEAFTDDRVVGVLTTLERGYYWSRVRPELSAVAPEGVGTAASAVYAVPRGEQELLSVVDVWLETRRTRGEENEAYAYWIRGQALAPRAPRWSVLHDVLGFGSHWPPAGHKR